MSYREIPLEKILNFKATPGFKGWKHLFTEESVVHPAKMNLGLLHWILSKYTSPSEVVLDPMAGTGSTIILAACMGRNGIAIEYEPHFCKLIQENITKMRDQKTLTEKGAVRCIRGDAQELSQYLNESDTIVLSPPYGNRLSDVVVDDGDTARMGYRQAINVIVTSPPYGNMETGNDDPRRVERLQAAIERGDDIHPRNIGWLNSRLRGEKQRTAFDREGRYSKNPENIGNLKYKKYLEAMKRVYTECYKVLKPSGRMVLVVKNFIRDKKIIRLDNDTIKLCELVGFSLIDRWYFKVPTKSFWKTLYHRKFPDVPKVDYEDVLVFEGFAVPPKPRGEP